MNLLALLARRSVREQRLALGLSILLVGGAVWQWLIVPLQNQVRLAQAQIVQAEQDLLDMQHSVQRLALLENQGGVVTGQVDGETAAYLAVDREAKRLQLPSARIDPSDDGARAQFDGVEFSVLAQLLDVLQRRYGLLATNVVLTRSDSGRVDGRITWKRR